MAKMKSGITKPRKFTGNNVPNKPVKARKGVETGASQTLGANNKYQAKKELMAKQGAITKKNKARRAKGIKGKPAGPSPTPRQVTALPDWKRDRVGMSKGFRTRIEAAEKRMDDWVDSKKKR